MKLLNGNDVIKMWRYVKHPPLVLYRQSLSLVLSYAVLKYLFSKIVKIIRQLCPSNGNDVINDDLYVKPKPPNYAMVIYRAKFQPNKLSFV